MKISEHVYALPLSADMMGHQTTLFPVVILDETHGATLVDTGIPGMQDDIEAALQNVGLSVTEVRRIIITHHDLDHIGSLPALVERTGAEVLTSAGERPYVQGEKPAQKLTAEMLAGMPPELRTLLAHPPKTTVNGVLQDGEVLDIAGGVRVIFSPGHTVGHLSLLVEQDGVLISGDALTSDAGELHGPMAQATPDMTAALKSVQKLAELPAKAVVTYHGGLVSDNAAQQLQALARSVGEQG